MVSRRPASKRASDRGIELLERRVLLSAGDLDPTFGAGGEAVLPTQANGLNLTVYATAVQPDGKIVLAGSASPPGGGLARFFAERLSADGTVDNSFGIHGIVTTLFADSAQAFAILIQPDGKIVLGGTDQAAVVPSPQLFALARYNADGSPDAGFGTSGKVLTKLPGTSHLQSIALAPGGKILAAGTGTYQDPAHPSDPNYSTGVFDVARYNANGSLDTSFNGAGYAYRQQDLLVWNINAVAVAARYDGKVLVGSEFKLDFAVWRFNVDGTLDTSFGLGGMTTTPFPYQSVNGGGAANFGSISRLLVQPDGKILAAGPEDDDFNARDTWALSRYNPDGSVDTTFGSGGLVTVDLHLLLGVAYDPGGVALQSDGKIIVGGVEAGFNGAGPFIAQRYLLDGTLDPAYHSSAISFSPDFMVGRIGATAMGPDGKVVIAGDVQGFGPPAGIGVARLQTDAPAESTPVQPPPGPAAPPGNLDLAFGFQGRTVVDDPSPLSLPDSLQHRVKAVAVQPDGKILLAGSVGTRADDGRDAFWVERLNRDGSVDTSFGRGGSVETAIGAFSFATAILIQGDGKIVVGGATVDSLNLISNASFALARYNADGSLDATFGSGGKVVTDFPGNEEVDSLALGPGGKIVAGGAYFLYPDVGFDVARYNSDGSLDKTFDQSGMFSRDLGRTGNNSGPAAVAVEAGGKILVGAHAGSLPAIYRINTDGTTDAGFGSGGVAINAAASGIASALAIQPDGKVIAGIQVLNPGSGLPPGTLYEVARFDSDGSLDGSFNAGGLVKVVGNADTGFGPGANLPQSYPVAALLLEPDGRIVVVGTQGAFDDNFVVGARLLVRRFLVDGSSDPSFQADTSPMFVPPPPYRGTIAAGAALGPDGKLLVAAEVWAGTAPGSSHWVGIARYVTGGPGPKTPPGDANLDGKVAFDDLLIVARDYGMTGAGWTDGDFNGDGKVGFDDLVIVARNYARSITTAAELLPGVRRIRMRR